ncbi:MAG: putative porin [Bacteroidota bacterium]
MRPVANALSVFLILLLGVSAFAQDPGIRGLGGRIGGGMPGMSGGGRFRGAMGGGGGDSLTKRNKLEDSITIHYRYLGSPTIYLLDSTVNEIDRRFPIRSDWVHLGNLGTAARPLAFSPRMQVGFDPGFHALDVYSWTPEQAKYFQTTRPYTELNYHLGSRAEQVIELLHTQNIRPQWNFMGGYRMINAPGFFQNQISNHHNYVLTSRYQSKDLRYTQFFSLTSNKLQVGENGGVNDPGGLLNDPVYKERYTLPTLLGGTNTFSANFFSTQIRTGNFYRTTQFLSRHQYDFGKKDSLVTDSLVIPLFFPRFRAEATFRYDRMRFGFRDERGDSSYYGPNYGWTWLQRYDTVNLQDEWKVLTGEFALYQFPDPKNLHQFLRVGLKVQSYHGQMEFYRPEFINTSVEGEYRNRTRNRKWDLLAGGELYLTGFNQGDYHVQASLLRALSKNKGSIRLQFEQSNRQPGFLFDTRSSFHQSPLAIDLKKENLTRISTAIRWDRIGIDLSGSYYLINRLAYWTDFNQPGQTDALFNLLQVQVAKTVRLGKNWRSNTELLWQQRIGSAPVNMIPFYIRQRIGYEGNLGFKNLQLATGLEIRYRPPYKADAYSPVFGQFYFQNTQTIRNTLPDLAAYAHFRIRPFTAFIRAENLNTARDLNGFGFTRNNPIAPGYYLPGLQIRVGVYWRFVN